MVVGYRSGTVLKVLSRIHPPKPRPGQLWQIPESVKYLDIVGFADNEHIRYLFAKAVNVLKLSCRTYDMYTGKQKCTATIFFPFRMMFIPLPSSLKHKNMPSADIGSIGVKYSTPPGTITLVDIFYSYCIELQQGFINQLNNLNSLYRLSHRLPKKLISCRTSIRVNYCLIGPTSSL